MVLVLACTLAQGVLGVFGGYYSKNLSIGAALNPFGLWDKK
jgi:hypothetical protein